MIRSELQKTLAEATQTDKRTAGVFLDTLSSLAIKKESEFRVTGLWQASEAEEESSRGLQPENTAEDQNSSQNGRQISSRQGCKRRDSGREKVALIDQTSCQK
jgi:hypothetical protein